MSTVKTDAITAVSAGGDLSLDGLGTGGVSIASTLKMTKGGDIASASPLVIDTDGNYFDVTGTTNFAAMTVESGNFFMLQFDSALTITHGSGIEIPGAANLTVAAGDRLICYATAANTVEVMSVETEAAAGGGGSRTFISDTTVSAATTLTITGLDNSAYRSYEIHIRNFTVSLDSAEQSMQIGDSGGITTAAYSYHTMKSNASGTGYLAFAGTSDSGWWLCDAVGSATGEAWNWQGTLFLGDGTNYPSIIGHGIRNDATAYARNDVISGSCNEASHVTTQFKLYQRSGANFTGKVTLFGIKHA